LNPHGLAPTSTSSCQAMSSPCRPVAFRLLTCMVGVGDRPCGGVLGTPCHRVGLQKWLQPACQPTAASGAVQPTREVATEVAAAAESVLSWRRSLVEAWLNRPLHNRDEPKCPSDCDRGPARVELEVASDSTTEWLGWVKVAQKGSEKGPAQLRLCRGTGSSGLAPGIARPADVLFLGKGTIPRPKVSAASEDPRVRSTLRYHDGELLGDAASYGDRPVKTGDLDGESDIAV
jgi:hypothetical protein